MRWGEGGEGPLPSPPPRPARTPLAPTRAAGTPRNRLRRGAFRVACPPARTHGGRPGCRVICTAALLASAPPPPPALGRRVVPPTHPAHPSPTPRPQPLPARRRAWPAVRDRKESRHWEVLGEGGAGLKGTTTSFQPGKKNRGWGEVGGEMESCSAVEWRKQCQKGMERLMHRCVRAPRPFSPNTPTPHSTALFPSRKVTQLFGSHASFLLVSQVLC